MLLEERVEKLIVAAVEAKGFQIVELTVDPRRRIRLAVDCDRGVGIEECAEVTRIVSDALEKGGVDPGAFHTEVMSPGLDRRLSQPRDFERFRGEAVRLRLHGKHEGRRNWSGRLVAATGAGSVRLAVEGGSEVEFPLGDIDEVRLVPKV